MDRGIPISLGLLKMLFSSPGGVKTHAIWGNDIKIMAREFRFAPGGSGQIVLRPLFLQAIF
jgi:hypothetical protein